MEAHAASHLDTMRALSAELVKETKPGNVVVSGAGVWLALSVLAAGSGGETAVGLDDFLGADGEDVTVLRQEVAAVLSSVAGLNHATAIWSRVSLLPEFVESFPDVSFDSSLNQASLDTWVREATDGLLTQFPVQVTPHTLLALADALALRARWASPFQPEATKSADFTLDGDDVVSVSMMNKNFPADTLRRTGRVAVWCNDARGEGEGAGCEFRFALGDPGIDQGEVLAALWSDVGEWSTAAGVRVSLPKFALQTRTDLMSLLSAGPAVAALTTEADFSGLSEVPLMIDQAVQDALVRLDEAGFEAAAVTAVGMRARAMRPATVEIEELTFDRPFAFAVVEPVSGLPLFTGWVADPTL